MTQPVQPSITDLRRRYNAYLEEQNQVSFAQRYSAPIFLTALGLFFLIGAIGFASGAIGGIATGVGCLVFAAAIAHHNAPKPDPRQALARKGVPVWGVLVQANSKLFEPGTMDLPCLVIFSFEPAGGHLDYMQRLAHEIFDLKETQQTDPDRRFVANLTTDERAYKYRRRRVPVSFTGGPTVYCADLYITRSCLSAGFLTERALPCFAELGETGMLELLPWWMAGGQDAPPP